MLQSKITPKIFQLTSKIPFKWIRFFFYPFILLITLPSGFKIKKSYFLFDKEKPFEITSGSKFWLPSYRSDSIQNHIFIYKNYFELELLMSLKNEVIGEAFAILDIGANIGNHSIFFARECKAKLVYAFEPIKQTYEMLVNNVKLNHLTNVISTYNFGVSDKKGLASILTAPIDNIGATSIMKDPKGMINLVSIDDFLQLEELHFVKIDVEAFEIHVLNGLRKTLEKFKPSVFIEVFNENFVEVQNIFSELGYKLTKEFENYNYLFEYHT